MPPVYLDTCVLIHRAELAGPQPSERTIKAGTPVADLLADGRDPCATSIVGLAEFHDVVTRMLRSNQAPDDVYDEAWWDAAIMGVMRDIEARRLVIRAEPPRQFEGAMSLVATATKDHGRKFRIWDAVHLMTAVDWSLELGERCELWTTDTDFSGFLDAFPQFASFVSIRNLDN